MSSYVVVILITFVGFITLAAILLVPVYRFLKREEQVSQHWTPEALARRAAAPAPGSAPAAEDAPEP